MRDAISANDIRNQSKTPYATFWCPMHCYEQITQNGSHDHVLQNPFTRSARNGLV